MVCLNGLIERDLRRDLERERERERSMSFIPGTIGPPLGGKFCLTKRHSGGLDVGCLLACKNRDFANCNWPFRLMLAHFRDSISCFKLWTSD